MLAISTKVNLSIRARLRSRVVYRHRVFFSSTSSLLLPRVDFRRLFAETVPVWNLPQAAICDYTVRRKRCAENIPAPVQTMPDTWIVAVCPLCGESRHYLPTDIFRGRLSVLLARKPVRSERWNF
jgi:hypothetical protein